MQRSSKKGALEEVRRGGPWGRPSQGRELLYFPLCSSCPVDRKINPNEAYSGWTSPPESLSVFGPLLGPFAALLPEIP